MKDEMRVAMSSVAAGLCTRMSTVEESAEERVEWVRDVLARASRIDRSEFSRKFIDNCARWTLDWARNGQPHVVVDVKLAASFMATEIPEEFSESVAPPWTAFIATVPAGILQETELSLLVVRGEDSNRLQGVNAIERANGEPSAFNGWVRLMFQDQGDVSGDGRGLIWNVCERWGDYAGRDLLERLEDRAGAVGNTLGRKRLQLLMRFVFGACVEMANRSASTTTTRRHPARARCLREQAEPKVWTIRLSRTVRVDARQYVREYLGGTRGSIKVQYMRRGHWRNQPHGPNRSLRKFIHIEPHWVGPDDAPIAVRSHSITT